MERTNVKAPKEPVRIRFRKLKCGSTSVYLDSYYNGIREYETLKIYLRPEKTRDDRLWNKEQLRLANAVKAERIVSLQNAEWGFRDRRQMRKLNFIDYLEKLAGDYESRGQATCGVLTRSAIRRLVDYKGRTVPMNAVTKEYLTGFIAYLDSERTVTRKKDGRSGKLSGAYKESLFARVMVALNKAVREGIILKNPGKDIDTVLKPHAGESTRAFLTLEEVKRMADTEYQPQNDVKAAFLFACFTGLRFSDLRGLTWDGISRGPDGSMRLDIKMKKTGRDIFIPLSANALSFLPERGGIPDGSRIFRRLPAQAGNADVRLRTLAVKAGINKHVTFHVARHTFATLMLAYGADLYTVSKLLGHSNIRTTQIYAKIVDENKRKAVDLIPDLSR